MKNTIPKKIPVLCCFTDTPLLQTVLFVPGESAYIFSKFNKLNMDTSQCGQQTNSHTCRKPTSPIWTLHYQLCAVKDLSFLKGKNPTVDSRMLMLPVLPYTR